MSLVGALGDEMLLWYLFSVADISCRLLYHVSIVPLWIDLDFVPCSRVQWLFTNNRLWAGRSSGLIKTHLRTIPLCTIRVRKVQSAVVEAVMRCE